MSVLMRAAILREPVGSSIGPWANDSMRRLSTWTAPRQQRLALATDADLTATYATIAGVEASVCA